MKRRQILLVVATCVVGIVAFLIGRWHRDVEPRYEGRKLSAWLDECDFSHPNRERATQAVKAIGTNALPWLMKWVRWEEPAWKQHAHSTVRRLPVRVPWLEHKLEPHSIALDRNLWTAFRIIGRSAAPALPELKRLSCDPKAKPYSRTKAFGCVLHVDPSAQTSDPNWMQAVTSLTPTIWLEMIGILANQVRP